MTHGKTSVCGLNIDRLTMLEALEKLDTFVTGRRQHYVCFCEGNLLSNVDCDPTLIPVLNGAGMMLADGIAVAALSRLAGRPVPERVTGPQFLPAACEYGIKRGYRHFFYGGEPGVADRLAAALIQRYPGLQVAGTRSPPFRDLTLPELLEEKSIIEASRPDLLWVALGSPRQEKWVASQSSAINVPVMLAVGAAFDFHSGNRPWAPSWIRAIGMEWLFRMVSGGPRILVRNCRAVPIAAKLVLRALASRRSRG